MSLLEQICDRRRETIRSLRAKLPLSALEASSHWTDTRRPFADALRRPAGEPVRVLAEIKRASPSAGPIRAGADPAEIAKIYAAAGASALSILTETEHFDGDPSFLARARAVVDLPLLMKDFVIDEWQIPWARSLGADALLLIVAVLDRVQLRDFAAIARELSLAALVEVHTEAECERALEMGANLIGINHRDLATFEIDLGLSERLRPRIPETTVAVAESGIRNRADALRLEALKIDALLVGESLMRAPDPGDALRSLRGVEKPA
jgi:indole-3-glycerol phosphate synthase